MVHGGALQSVAPCMGFALALLVAPCGNLPSQMLLCMPEPCCIMQMGSRAPSA